MTAPHPQPHKQTKETFIDVDDAEVILGNTDCFGLISWCEHEVQCLDYPECHKAWVKKQRAKRCC